MSADLLRRWRGLPPARREDIINRAWVYAFAVIVSVGGVLILLGTWIGTEAALATVVALGMFAALGAFLAGRRGRSRWVWGVVCFLLPLLGLVMLLLLKDDEWRMPRT